VTGRQGPYRTVGIVGGGTAGYLTAIALRAHHPQLRVTLIESPEIPIIGVGEATTPLIVKFLHSFLKKDINDLFRRVDATWKLGIRFEWGLPPPYYFNYAFHPGNLLEGLAHGRDFNSYSFGSLLMSANRVPIVHEGNRFTSLLDKVPFAYHLDNVKFVAYLREEAIADGVRRLERTIARVCTDGEGRVTALQTPEGEELSFDLYVDCSGFRSELLEKAAGSRYVTFESTLFTDSAIAANVPHGGKIKPYTVAETMDAGWCWNIPTVADDHRGYVFSSAFMTVDEAVEEMRRKNPGMGEHRVVRFRSGRHEHFWKGNVVAVGNSYGFVEPLESTGIHMIVHEINQLVLNLPASQDDEAIKRVVNKKLNEHWDSIRWFLGVHYRFNRRFDTPFWRACNADADISGALDRVDVFRERAPLTYRQSLFHKPEEIFSDFGYDILLMGQQVDAHYLDPLDTRAAWHERRQGLTALVDRALSHGAAVELLRRSPPEILEQVVTAQGTWATWP
jgi:tryptophan halogenase